MYISVVELSLLRTIAPNMTTTTVMVAEKNTPIMNMESPSMLPFLCMTIAVMNDINSAATIATTVIVSNFSAFASIILDVCSNLINSHLSDYDLLR